MAQVVVSVLMPVFMFVLMVSVFMMLMLPPAVGMGVVGLLVDPAVEEVGTQVSDQYPAKHRQDAGFLRRVGHQVEADHAEHHPRREAEQEADGPVGRAVDRGGQPAAQREAAHAGKGGDEEDRQIGVHEQCSISNAPRGLKIPYE